MSELFTRIKNEIANQIVGQEPLIERLLVALISNGHVLLEGVPGLAKTKTLKALAMCIDAKMNRIQFTPDLLPSDVIGTEIFKSASAELSIRKGPVFTNILLADEVNRAPAKVQSALLQAMQEREVTIGEQTFILPDPFLVLATQNPIEQEGTYPLPEAQVDRFLLKLRIDYPKFEEELQIIKLNSNSNRDIEIKKVINLEQLKELREQANQIYVDPKIDHYIVSLVQASRSADAFGLRGMIEWGASPRASIALRTSSQSLALLRSDKFVTPEHVRDLVHDVLRHRIIPSFEAEARSIDSDEIIGTIVKSVTVP
jgi:MoxR-like ATPase